jgi:hypothetical protein
MQSVLSSVTVARRTLSCARSRAAGARFSPIIITTAPVTNGGIRLSIQAEPVPPVASVGRGLASYLVTQDSATLYYSLQVLDVSSPITAAHIHLGHTGQDGDVVANLCGGGGAPPCAASGVIATGTITSGSLVGPLAGHPLSDLVIAMTAGSTYTNVHTSNFPDGEIRGQVLLVTAVGEPEHENGQGNNEQHDNGGQNHDNQDEGD